MGVYPEPALCADDVCRLVSRVSAVSIDYAGASAGKASRSKRKVTNATSHKSRKLSAVLVALTLGTSLPTVVAHAGVTNGAVAPQIRSDQRSAAQPPIWGGVDLKVQEPATLAVLDNDPASLPESKARPDTMRFGERNVPRTIVETILRASEATGVDPVYMMALADKESSFNASVKSSASSAQGLFQFITGTWLEMIRDHGAKHGFGAEAAAIRGRGAAMSIADAGMRNRILALRNDPYVSGLMAGELIKRDRAKIEARIGRELKTTELYLAHFLGTASAGKFLSLHAEDPERSAQREFSNAARANRSIFTVSDGGKRRSLTVAEVHERLDGMIDRRMDQYEAGIAALSEQPMEAGNAELSTVLDARLRLEPAAVPAIVEPVIQ